MIMVEQLGITGTILELLVWDSVSHAVILIYDHKIRFGHIVNCFVNCLLS